MKTINKIIPNNISYINGDLFNYIEQVVRAGNNGSSIIVPHVCNNINVFGAGFAKQVADKYPIVKENYHLLGLNFLKNNFGHTQFIEVYKDKTHEHSLIFANMIAQNGVIGHKNTRPLNYIALCKSMTLISKYIQDKFSKDEGIQIHCPKFGCGLAGGNWGIVEQLIIDAWYKFPVFIYQK